MITLGNSAFKPYAREQSLDSLGRESVPGSTPSSTTSPDATLTSPPKSADVDLLTQLSLIASITSYADTNTLMQMGLSELLTAAQAASQIVAQVGAGVPLSAIQASVGALPPSSACLSSLLPSTVSPPSLQQISNMTSSLNTSVTSTASLSSGLSVTPPMLQEPAAITQSLNAVIPSPYAPTSIPANSQSQSSLSSGGGAMRTPQSYPSTSSDQYSRSVGGDESKGKRKRTTFTPQQALQLEKEYELDQYMPRNRRISVAESLRLTESQIKTWFQNRRAKDKKARQTDGPGSPQHSPVKQQQQTPQQGQQVPPPVQYNSYIQNTQQSATEPNATLSQEQQHQLNGYGMGQGQPMQIYGIGSAGYSPNTSTDMKPFANVDMNNAYQPQFAQQASLPADIYSQLGYDQTQQLASLAAAFGQSQQIHEQQHQHQNQNQMSCEQNNSQSPSTYSASTSSTPQPL